MPDFEKMTDGELRSFRAECIRRMDADKAEQVAAGVVLYRKRAESDAKWARAAALALGRGIMGNAQTELAERLFALPDGEMEAAAQAVPEGDIAAAYAAARSAVVLK